MRYLFVTAAVGLAGWLAQGYLTVWQDRVGDRAFEMITNGMTGVALVFLWFFLCDLVESKEDKELRAKVQRRYRSWNEH